MRPGRTSIQSSPYPSTDSPAEHAISESRPYGDSSKSPNRPRERCGGIHGGPRPLHRNILRVGRPLLFSPERFRGRDARDRGSLNLRNQVLFLAGGRRSSSGRSSSGRSSSGERPRGSSGAGILRFPHRWTDPRCRESIVLRPVSAHNPSGKQEQTRTDDPRATPGAEPVPERVPGSAAFSVRFLAG